MAASDALDAARLFAVDPGGTGVWLRAGPGPARERWLAALRALWPAAAPLRRIPAAVTEDRLLGGLDLAATLAAGRRVAERGLLAATHGGALIIAMAERMPPAVAAQIAAALDTGEVALQRDGFDRRDPARFGVIALDEGIGEEERPPAALTDRLAIHLVLDGMPPPFAAAEGIAAARARLPRVAADAAVLQALCAAALALGIASLRAPLQALAVARAAAALAGRAAVAEADVALAARLVLAPRATRLPTPPADPPPPAPPPEPAGGEDSAAGRSPLAEVVLAAAQAALPPGLLAALAGGGVRRGRAEGRLGTPARAHRHGRPAGSRPGRLGGGARLALVATLRAAAPWQGLRRRAGTAPRRLVVHRDDIRILRLKAPPRSTAIFAVDASGSAAAARLAEAKGAVERLLADCYVRRDSVALIAFRGTTAELVLPPTASLARARRALAGLPGGGGTPLAAALELIGRVAEGVVREGRRPLAVLLTDGHANIARDGTAGRARAEQDALAMAARLRAAGLAALLIDTAPRPQPAAARLAEAMGARYLALPYADAAALSGAVRAEIAARR